MGIYRMLLEEELAKYNADEVLRAQDAEFTDPGTEDSIDDIMNESWIAIYEYDSAMASIMTEIGIRSLNEAAKGKVVVVEAADFSIFFKKVKNAIRKFFEKIFSFFKHFAQNIMILYRKIFNIYNANKSRIESGYNNYKNLEPPEIYEKSNNRIPGDFVIEYIDDMDTIDSVAKAANAKNIEELNDLDIDEKTYQDALFRILRSTTNDDYLHIDTIQDSYKDFILGKKIKKWPTPESIGNEIKNSKRFDISYKRGEEKIKSLHRDLIKNLDILERKVKQIDDEKERAKYLKICATISKNENLFLTCMQKMIAACFSAEKVFLDQAIKYANLYIGKENSDNSDNEDISEEFKDAVDKKNLLLTHIMLKDAIIMDLTHDLFNARLKYAEKHLDNLYDDHDGEEFSNDKSTWTRDLFNEQNVKLIMNFSKERLKFLLKLCTYLHSDEIKDKKKKDELIKKYFGKDAF